MILLRIVSRFDNWEYFNFESFLWIGVILLVLKMFGNISYEKDMLKREVSRLDISLFKSYRTLVGILFGPTVL